MKRFEKKETGFITQVELKQTRGQIIYWVMFAVLIVVSICTFAPPLWILVSGFKDLDEFFLVPPTIIPQSFHPEKLVEVWKKFDYILYYRNTLFVALGSIVSGVVLNGLAGYVLSRLKPKGSKAVFMMILFIMMMPNTIGMVPLYLTICDFPYMHFNMLGTFWPMWLMAAASCFHILMFKSFFDSIPLSYIEAARIDGCSNVGIFFKIVVPLSIPVIMTVAIFIFNNSWGDFLWPYLVLNNKKLYTVSIFLFQNKAGNYSVDVYMVMLTLAIVPPVIVYAFLQKHIMGGMNLGGIKG
ncbi:MAG: carbohydrate ABC transporter permease [Clostridia bacterium]|nr:carbohydrate ABC transporter permease [Clostridia bacterium]MBP3360088.1 carbohydrate ABC transporter permease [Clostridia bacterium]